MKGMEYRLLTVIIILAVITLIGIIGFAYVREMPITDYLSASFNICGFDKGSLCCNLERPELEPFCSAGLVCDVKVDTTKLSDPDVLKAYKQSKCTDVQESLVILTDQYVFNNSCVNGFINGVDGAECNYTAVSRDFLIGMLRENAMGVGMYNRDEYDKYKTSNDANTISFSVGKQDCKNVYDCTECTRYFQFENPYQCTDCSGCDGTGKCDACSQCAKSTDTRAKQDYSDCSYCGDCSACINDEETDMTSCESCKQCDICFNTDSYPPDSNLAYCQESDVCNDTTCLNNFYCGQDKNTFDQNFMCNYCKPKADTTCEKVVEPNICEEIKDCLRMKTDKSESCYLMIDDYVPVVEHTSDAERPFTSGMDYFPDWSKDATISTLALDLRKVVSQCLNEPLYKYATEDGIEQKVCDFKAPSDMRLVWDAGQLPKAIVYDNNGEKVVLPGFLTEYTFNNPDTDLDRQDENVWFNDCGNISGKSEFYYDCLKSKKCEPGGADFNNLLFVNDGQLFESNTMPKGTSIKLAVSDMSYFKPYLSGESLKYSNDCDFNMYVCSQQMLVDPNNWGENDDPLQLYGYIRDMFQLSLLPDMGDQTSPFVSKIASHKIENGKEVLMTPEDSARYGFEYSDDAYYTRDSYLIAFNKLDSNPTFKINIGKEPMDAGHIGNMVVAGTRDWSLMISSNASEIYKNTKDFICQYALGKSPTDECNIEVAYDYRSPWQLQELDYSNLASTKYAGYCAEEDILTGQCFYKTCTEDLVGGACGSQATDHPCWGWCTDHKYELDSSKNLLNTIVEYKTGGTENCESDISLIFTHEDDKTYELNDGKAKRFTGTSHNAGLPEASSFKEFTLKDNANCYIDNSNVFLKYDTGKESIDSKNIYYLKTSDPNGYYRSNIDVYLGYMVTMNEYDGRTVATIHPIVKFKQS